MTIPSSITPLVRQARKSTGNIHLCSHNGRGEGGSALQTLRIQFCFSSANGWHLVLLTVDDSFQRNCCASRGYLNGNEGFLAYFSSSILAMSLCGIINSLMGAQCFQADSPCLTWCIWSLLGTSNDSIRTMPEIWRIMGLLPGSEYQRQQVVMLGVRGKVRAYHRINVFEHLDFVILFFSGLHVPLGHLTCPCMYGQPVG